MKTVLLFARDPGGANVIMPIYHKIKAKYRTLAYAKEFALKRFEDNGLPARDIKEDCRVGTYADTRSFLERINPDIVITGTSLDDFTERYLWKAAEELGIKSFAILDQWANLGIRFSEYDYSREEAYRKNHVHSFLPYRILAMDSLAEKLLAEDGVEKERIVVTGQPHFDTVREKFCHAKEIYGRDRWNVVFVSEPIFQDYDRCDEAELYWGFNERTVFGSLYRNLKKVAECYSGRIRLIIRPHPRENPGNWQQVMETLEDDDITLEMDKVHDSFSVMKSADLVCGMSSMFLLEAAICGKAVMSIMIGLRRENPFVLDKIGCCKSIMSEEELRRKLICAYRQEEKICAFSFVQNASERVIKCVEEEMAR